MKCPKCQFDNPEGAKFCIECGHKFGEELAIEGERKQVTVLFSDLSGYTAMSERLDPEEVKNIISRIFGEIAQVVAKYDGSIEKFIGDAVVAFFGVPKAHEDDPVRALRAAREIHEIVNAMSHQFESKVGKPLSMHTGINTGLVVTGEVTTEKGPLGVTGDTVNVASRLSGLAKPGEILVGEDTYRQAEGLFNFAPLTPVSIKGKAEPIRACRVLSPKEEPTKTHRLSGLRSELIGRKVEMSQLKEAAQRLLEGKGTIFYITGDAGTGKSRLIEEFKATLDLNRIQWREGHSYAYASNIPYFPLMDLLSRAWQIEDGDSQERLKQKIEAGITNLMGDGKDVIPFIGSLYSIKYPEIENISPEYWKMKLHESIQSIVSALTRRAPAVICLEDLHWTDPSSIELLRTILLKFNYPALFLCVSRPQFNLFTSQQLSGIGKFYYEMRLKDLSPTEAQGMVESLLKTETIPAELKNFIQRKAEGNPFYLEEVINSLIERETLIEKENTWVLTRPLAGIDIPSTVQGVISARLDRLEKETKRILQEASVIGRVFLYEILRRITELKEQIDRSLHGLERLDLIRTRTLDPDLEYIFKHALTQEVAYNSLLLKRRKEIHERIGKAIEELFPYRLEEFYETLAYHYSRSDYLEKAFQYLRLSASKATQNNSLWEALRFYKESLNILKQIPETNQNKKERIEVIISMMPIIRNLGFPEDPAEILQDAERLCEEFQDKRSMALIYSYTGMYYSFKGNLTLGRSYLEQSLSEAEKVSDLNILGPLAYGLFANYIIEGNYIRVADIAPRIIRLLEEKHRELEDFGTPANLYATLHAQYGLCLAALGDLERWEDLCKRGVSFGREVGHLFSIGLAEMFYGISVAWRGGGEKAIEHLQISIDNFEKSQGTLFLPNAWTHMGLAYCFIGNTSKALECTDKALKMQVASGLPFFLPLPHVALSIVHLELNDLEDALFHAEEAIKIAKKNKERHWEAVSLWQLGMVGWRSKKIKIDEAEQSIRQGIRILNELEMKAFEMMGYLYLGELFTYANEREKALKILRMTEKAFQEMKMDYWLSRTQKALARVNY